MPGTARLLLNSTTTDSWDDSIPTGCKWGNGATGTFRFHARWAELLRHRTATTVCGPSTRYVPRSSTAVTPLMTSVPRPVGSTRHGHLPRRRLAGLHRPRQLHRRGRATARLRDPQARGQERRLRRRVRGRATWRPRRFWRRRSRCRWCRSASERPLSFRPT